LCKNPIACCTKVTGYTYDAFGSVTGSGASDFLNEVTLKTRGRFICPSDPRGSVTNIIKLDGTKVKGYTYDAFGSVTGSGASDFLNEVTFCGEPDE